MGKLAKLTPHLSYTIWGGKYLSKIKGIESTENLGETWEVSTLRSGSAKIGDKNLSDFCSLSYLVKFIDTADNLSVQVHPGDEYAAEFENSKGKTECWIILEAEENAGIYLGFKKGVTRKEFKTAIINSLDVEKFLNFIPVKSGDFFYVPSGSVHAIGKGVTLAEVQQSSGITYRVWDWNRVDADGKGRELHIEKAMDVLEFNERFNEKLLNQINLFEKDGIHNFVKHEDFKSSILSLKAGTKTEVKLLEKESLSVLSGSVKVEEVTLPLFNSAISLVSSIVEIYALEDAKIILTSE